MGLMLVCPALFASPLLRVLFEFQLLSRANKHTQFQPWFFERFIVDTQQLALPYQMTICMCPTRRSQFLTRIELRSLPLSRKFERSRAAKRRDGARRRTIRDGTKNETPRGYHQKVTKTDTRHLFFRSGK